MRLNKKGQALIEFIIILPIFLFMLFVVIDFGVISFNKSKMDSMIVDVGNMYKNKESNDEINKFIKKNDSDVSVSFNDQGKYFDITLSKNYEFITPGMSSILKNFKIDVERTMYNEQ